MARSAQDLVRDLQTVLGIEYLKTGQIVLHLHQGHVESFETKTSVRLKPRQKTENIASDDKLVHTNERM